MFKNKFYLFYMLLLFIIIIFFSTYDIKANGFIEYSEYLLLDNNIYTINDLRNNSYLPIHIDSNGILNLNRRTNYTFKLKGYDLYLGYLNDIEYYGEADPETITFAINLVQNNNNIPGKDYNLDFEFWYQKKSGIFIGGKLWEDRSTGIEMYWNGTIYNIDEFILHKYYNGVVREQNAKFSFKGDFITKNSNMKGLVADDFYGFGYGLDYNLIWNINDKKTIEFAANNFLNRFYWYNLHYEYGDFDSERRRFKYAFWNNMDFTSNITPEYMLSYKHERAKLGLMYKDKALPFFNYNIIKKPINIVLGKYTHFYTLDLAYNTKYIDITSKINFNLTNPISTTVQFSVRMNY